MIQDLAYNSRTLQWEIMAIVTLAVAVVLFWRARSILSHGGYPRFPGRAPGESIFPLSGLIVIGWFFLNLSSLAFSATVLRLMGPTASRDHAILVATIGLFFLQSLFWFAWRAVRGSVLTERDLRAIVATWPHLGPSHTGSPPP